MSKKIFSCTKCGEPITVYPPDDMHPDAARNKGDLIQNDIIKIDYKCKNQDCKAMNTVYWGSQRISIAVA